jgi:multisubunit Na+/H+ antiporter MnhC subunit
VAVNSPWEDVALVLIAVAVGLAVLAFTLGFLLGIIEWATRPLRRRLARREPLPRHRRTR